VRKSPITCHLASVRVVDIDEAYDTILLDILKTSM